MYARELQETISQFFSRFDNEVPEVEGQEATDLHVKERLSEIILA